MSVGPQPGPQTTFMTTEADIAIFGGAYGGGKTWSLLLDPLSYVDHRGFNCVVFRRTMEQVRQAGGIWDKSGEIYPNWRIPGTPRVQGTRWYFGNPMTPMTPYIEFAGCQYEHDRLGWKGAQIVAMFFDQLEEFTETIFWFLQSRNRSTCGVRSYVRATCNPVPDDDEVGGWLHKLIEWWLHPEGHDLYGFPDEARSGVLRWFLRFGDDLIWADTQAGCTQLGRDRGMPEDVLIDEITGETMAKSMTFIASRLEDNPALMLADPTYKGTLLAMTDVEMRRGYLGDWNARAKAGEVFDRSKFGIIETAPDAPYAVRYWDKAATLGGGAYTCGVLVMHIDDRIVVVDVVRGQWDTHARRNIMRATARQDGPTVLQVVEQEPGSSGVDSGYDDVGILAGSWVELDKVTGSKDHRMRPWASQVQGGHADLVRAEWNAQFLAEHHAVPDGMYRDQVDAAGGAVIWLTGDRVDWSPVLERVFDLETAGGFVI